METGESRKDAGRIGVDGGLSRRQFSRLLAAAAVASGAGPLLGCERQPEVEAGPEYQILAEGLRFPEGPVALTDGSVLVVEIDRGTLTRVDVDGKVDVVADLGGGPNGAAIGPGGACYVCNGGGENFRDVGGLLLPTGQPDDYAGGRIQRVELATGRIDVLYTEVDGHKLRGPNDLVFDRSGGFWFTDLGKSRPRERDHGGLYYARADGSMIREVIYPITAPNGVGLSPDGKTLYVSELLSARLIAYDIVGEGDIAASSGRFPGRFIGAAPGRSLFDSMAIEANGNICVATILNSAITCFSPGGAIVDIVPTPDIVTTNICFGGTDFTTAFVTLGGSGKLIEMDWPRPGLPLNFAA